MGIRRDYLINHSRLDENALNSLSDRYSNVQVFDAFPELWPKLRDLCTSENYFDQWHLSIFVALSLNQALINKLN